MKSKSIAVFTLSLTIGCMLLLAERLVGIDWDYHPDSVTYATNSTNTVHSILETNPYLVFNNLYYFICHFLNENILIITAMNLILYSLTNVMIAKLHDKAMIDIGIKGNKAMFLLLLLLLNPYRLHLSTTILKDTWIILLITASISFTGVKYYLIAIVMFVIRISSLLYAIVLFNKKSLRLLVIFSLIGILVFQTEISERALEFNEAEMQLRSFDVIPTFQQHGLVGVAIRSLLWPILAVTGAFAVISPALPFFAVALGSVINNLYTIFSIKKLCLEPKSMIILSLFAAMVTGYTAYIRYIYPVITIMPILVLQYYSINQKRTQNDFI